MGKIIGWDDAPLVEIGRSSTPKHVTFVYPYYENPLFLAAQLAGWRAFPAELRHHLSAIIVDDGSPEHPASLVDRPFPIRLFRIDVDVRWNWLAARNIAMHNVSGWCLATDMDHVIPQATAEAAVWGMHDKRVIYRFSRENHDGSPCHPHPNSWLMTQEMFWRFGGYDEALSGYYGTDGEARRRWVKTALVLTLPQKLVRHERQLDASTLRYQRKEAIDARAQALIKARGKHWKPRVLSFPYHEVLWSTTSSG